MSQLESSDYKKILHFYNVSIPKNKKSLKKKAEQMITKKLCKCIKKFDKKYEAKAIGICTRSVVNEKGLSRGKFTCKKRRTIHLMKTMKHRK